MDLKGKIVFSAGKPARFQIWVIDLLNRTLSQLTKGDYFCDSPKWSPDGSRIVYVSNKSGFPQVWLMNEDGSDQHPLTNADKHHSHPSWSPGGRKIVFISSTGRAGGMGLWVMGVDSGSAPELLTTIPGMPASPHWTPDGRKIILSAPIKGAYNIWEYTVSAQSWRRITEGKSDDISPALAPNGKILAFVSSRESDVLDSFGGYGIWIADSDGSNRRRVSGSKEQDTDVCWSPDGRYLMYCASSPGSSRERLKVKDMIKDLSHTLEFSRAQLKKAMSEPIETRTSLLSILGLMPENLKRMFYDDSFYGTEKQPHWKY